MQSEEISLSERDFQIMRRGISALAAYDKAKRTDTFRALADVVEKGQTVFIGDSITEGFPLNELLPGKVLFNRGVGGDTSSELLERLPYTVLALLPQKVFLQIGTNDLKAGMPQEQTVLNVRTALGQIRAASPFAKIFVVGVYPVCLHDKFMSMPTGAHILQGRTQEEIRELNEKYCAMCGELGAEFLDFTDILSDQEGDLREEYTTDGLHLTVSAYCELAKELKKYL